MAIDWRPIAELPDNLKDGREVLLWETVAGIGAEIASWSPSAMWKPLAVRNKEGVWCDRAGFTIRGITHYAEIGPP
ncbi:hypothetical protein U5A82_17400 [Sphingobium sp. CR2-8]|uniref:hypothetical protein n=1 Tax=Sphingobium sp. CR2-8 TaxID=1306534 RepID=UPI002DB683D2|nr:hypothetical protein [Sphingobium sp. CR2-8]MEC3912185.1 hypothetical protein [Sphingobium sp. CR2-8]